MFKFEESIPELDLGLELYKKFYEISGTQTFTLLDSNGNTIEWSGEGSSDTIVYHEGTLAHSGESEWSYSQTYNHVEELHKQIREIMNTEFKQQLLDEIKEYIYGERRTEIHI